MISVQSLSKFYGDRCVLNELSFDVKKGECFGIIGPNGSGKSTLLKMISGILASSNGTVSLNKISIKKWSQKSLAKKMAVLSQNPLPPYPITVFETVMMGRYPHLGLFQREGKKDFEIVEKVLEQTGMLHLKGAMLDTLSGGERQRVAIAKAMVQEPEILLLDEPTTYLDIGYQVSVLNIVKKWQQEAGLTIFMVLHDLNLASQYCDRLLLLKEGRAMKLGSSKEVLNKENIQHVYDTDPEIIIHPTLDVPQILLTCGGNKNADALLFRC